MIVVECDSCRNAFSAELRLAGKTTKCPECSASLYVPLPHGIEVSFSDKKPAGKLDDAEASVENPLPPVATASAAASSTSVRHLAPIGWLLFSLGVGLKFLNTPTTELLSWILIVGAIGTAVFMMRLRGVRAGIVLLIATILVPTAISLVFWHYVRKAAEAEAAKIERVTDLILGEMEATAREMKRSFESLGAAAGKPLPAPKPLTAPPALKSLTAPPAPKSMTAPPAPKPDWSLARQKVRLTGTMEKDGVRYGVVDGVPRRESETVFTHVGDFVYYWRVRLREWGADLEPVRANAP